MRHTAWILGFGWLCGCAEPGTFAVIKVSDPNAFARLAGSIVVYIDEPTKSAATFAISNGFPATFTLEANTAGTHLLTVDAQEDGTTVARAVVGVVFKQGKSDTLEVVLLRPCEVSSDCDDGAFCSGAETCEERVCKSGAAPCGVPFDCVLSTCEELGGGDGRCLVSVDHAQCDEGKYCDPTQGCVTGKGCLEDADCPDASICNGSEICYPNFECGPGPALQSDDGNPCTLDGCNESVGVFHVPDANQDGTVCSLADLVAICRAPDGCVESVCGDTIVGPQEECDDANSDPYDGCDQCLLATPQSCVGVLSLFDQSSLATSTLVVSNLAQISGMDAACVATISVSGPGSPQYRLCTSAQCTTVLQDWTSAPISVAPQGRYVQVRATTSATENTPSVITLIVGQGSDTWTLTTLDPNACHLLPPGTVCPDGTLYAGQSADGNVPMFTTRCDVGMNWDAVNATCTGARTLRAANGATASAYNTVLADCTSDAGCPVSGRAETAVLALSDSEATSGFQPHEAALACAGLNSNGYDDWYLPSISELAVLAANQVAIGQFSTAYLYQSTSEQGPSYNWRYDFATNNALTAVKESRRHVRCVRQAGRSSPDPFVLSSQTGLPAGARPVSNIVELANIENNVPIVAVDLGQPEIRVCSDATCSGLPLVDWTDQPLTIQNGSFVQVRMWASASVSTARTITLRVGTLNVTWTVTTSATDPCSTNSAPGAMCADGTVYIGQTPDGNVPMYMMRCYDGQTFFDGAGCIGNANKMPWNDGSGSGFVDTSLTGCNSQPACDPSGATQTPILAMADSNTAVGVQAHVAAQYCDSLVLSGYSDWYLPSIVELKVALDNQSSIAYVASGGHWAVNEGLLSTAWIGNFTAATTGTIGKHGLYYVRCVRK